MAHSLRQQDCFFLLLRDTFPKKFGFVFTLHSVGGGNGNEERFSQIQTNADENARWAAETTNSPGLNVENRMCSHFHTRNAQENIATWGSEQFARREYKTAEFNTTVDLADRKCLVWLLASVKGNPSLVTLAESQPTVILPFVDFLPFPMRVFHDCRSFALT